MTNNKTGSASLVGELLGIAIGLVVLLYLFPHLPFVTADYTLWLPIGVAATIVGGICKIFSHITRIVPIARLFRITDHVVSIVSIYILRAIFPFDFGQIGKASLNAIVSFAFLIALCAMVLAIVIETVKLITLAPLKKK